MNKKPVFKISYIEASIITITNLATIKFCEHNLRIMGRTQGIIDRFWENLGIE